ncbi:MAG TPA: glycerol-3-phosphate 1-O-acyltransferase PlsY [Nevskiaceae bacterium]|nr:glycerol-3-phosphate 1-O-acyltransferase PlsY [Nevskiaceae bacterium]
MELALDLLLAYLLGTVMGGDVIGRLRGGVDLRASGSGNVGATNALRTQGRGFALAVLAVDAGKGALAVTLLPALTLPLPASGFVLPALWTAYLCGVAVVLGHCYPVFRGFAGGKGVATLAGVFAALLPQALLLMLAGFVLVVLLSGYVSLATVTSAVLAVFYAACLAESGLLSALGLFTLMMSLLVVFTHRHNLRRLWRGEEHRFERARLLGRWLEQRLGRP